MTKLTTPLMPMLSRQPKLLEKALRTVVVGDTGPICSSIIATIAPAR